jgi:hypothetical protein
VVNTYRPEMRNFVTVGDWNLGHKLIRRNVKHSATRQLICTSTISYNYSTKQQEMGDVPRTKALELSFGLKCTTYIVPRCRDRVISCEHLFLNFEPNFELNHRLHSGL